MALLTEQKAAAKVQRVFEEATASRCQLWMTSVNLGEIWYSFSRRESEDAADFRVDRILQSGVQIASVDWALALRAARLKAKYAIAYADCFAAALAQQLRTKVVTGDPEFRRLEKEVKVLWVGD
jgi:ribonuclease VapC